MQASRRWTVSDWQQKLESLQPSKIELGLARVSEVAHRLGLNAENALAQKVITVGGTNGKGSTVCVLEGLLLKAGYRVAAYTSPHILHFNERIRIMGEPVNDEALCEAFSSVEAASQGTELTYFEFTTLAAMQLFRHASLDFALLEVGLGGRLDAVNIIDADLAIITSIDLDHQDWLGDTREAIAQEKAEIMRAGSPALCGDIDPPLPLLEHAQQLNVDLRLIDKDFGFKAAEKDEWSFWSTEDSRNLTELPQPNLPLTSAALAVEALQHLQIDVTRETILQVLQAAALPGRYQKITAANAQGIGVNYILDVAHNPQAVRYLADKIRSEQVAGKVFAICAILADKDADTIVRLMSNRVDAWFLAQLKAERALPTAQLHHLVKEVCGSPAHQCASMSDAITEVSEQAGANDLVVIFGSFYTVAEGLEIIGEA